MKKIKIVRVEENECKENRKYSWCVFREKNINATWRTGKLGHDDVHHDTRLQYL